MYPRLPMPGQILQPGTATRWLIHFLRVPPEDIIGCTPEEIAVIEEAASHRLPLAYKQWMVEAGRTSGSNIAADHFRRAKVLFPKVLEVRETLTGVLDESGAPRSLLETVIPFYDWEVYRLLVLDVSRPSENPPVLAVDESTGHPWLIYPSFSQFLIHEIFCLADGIAMDEARARDKRNHPHPGGPVPG